MSSSVVSCQLQGDAACAVITIERPERRNALNNQVIGELLALLQQAAADPAVRSVILTGAGGRAFSAGADLIELRARDHVSETGPAAARRREVAALLERMPKPTIAAINGHAVGGGLELAMACTFRIASSAAKLGLPEVTLGILPGNGGTQRLRRLVGLGRALELVLSGKLIDAAEAERIGLVLRTVPATDVLSESIGLAKLLAGLPQRALAAAKDAVLIGADLPLDPALSFENKWFALLCGSPEKTAALESRAVE